MRVAVFASGNGSNFEVISKYKYEHLKVVLLIVNRKDAYAIKRAELLNIPYYFADYSNGIELAEKAILKRLIMHQVDVIVLAGYMKIIDNLLLENYPNRIINIHPTILPLFKGYGALKRAYLSGLEKSGVTVHYVNNELDGGEIIEQMEFSIKGLTEEEFEKKTHEIEHILYPKVIKRLFDKKQMKVLIVGKGGREHALCKAIYKSTLYPKVYCAPGNKAFLNCHKVDIEEEDIFALRDFAKKEEIDLTIVGPENSIDLAIADFFEEYDLKIFAPKRLSALIESSKGFGKIFMDKYDIPTAAYEKFEKYEDAMEFIENQSFPLVIKYDGLASGKGVVIAHTKEEAKKTINKMMKLRQFGYDGVVIEKFLEGDEFSFLGLVNGNNVIPLEVSQDHKRAFDFDQGPNTGGMGCYSPVSFVTEEDKKIGLDILQKVADGLVLENLSFVGCLYAGLIKTNEGIKVIEFNCRFGDPEAEVILPRLKSDLLKVILDLMDNKKTELIWSSDVCVGVVMASKGYPGDYLRGEVLENTFQEGIYHMGTRMEGSSVISSGGRVLIVTELASSFKEARDKVYQKISTIGHKNLFYRTDIGKREDKK